MTSLGVRVHEPGDNLLALQVIFEIQPIVFRQTRAERQQRRTVFFK